MGSVHPLHAVAFICLLLVLAAPPSSASPTPHANPKGNTTIECQLCIETLVALANYSLDDPRRVDWLLAHVFDAASAAGICAKDGGPSGVLTPDVCLGAIGEYGPLIANIVAARPPLLRETVQFACEALKLCPIAPLSAPTPLHVRAPAACSSSPPPRHPAACLTGARSTARQTLPWGAWTWSRSG